MVVGSGVTRLEVRVDEAVEVRRWGYFADMRDWSRRGDGTSFEGNLSKSDAVPLVAMGGR